MKSTNEESPGGSRKNKSHYTLSITEMSPQQVKEYEDLKKPLENIPKEKFGEKIMERILQDPRWNEFQEKKLPKIAPDETATLTILVTTIPSKNLKVAIQGNKPADFSATVLQQHLQMAIENEQEKSYTVTHVHFDYFPYDNKGVSKGGGHTAYIG